MDDASIALALARARIGFGIVAVIAPGAAARLIAREDGEAAGVAPVLARMVGFRDLVLGLGTVIALDKGTPVRGWLEAAALADAGDCISAVIGQRRLSPRAFVGTLGLAGFSTAACAVLSRRLDPPPPARPGQPESVATGHHD
jgi:hypothetical protein